MKMLGMIVFQGQTAIGILLRVRKFHVVCVWVEDASEWRKDLAAGRSRRYLQVLRLKVADRLSTKVP